MMPASAIDDPSHHTTRAEVATLGTRVGQLEKGMGVIGDKLDALVGLISARGQTNWTHIFAAGSLLTAVLSLVGAVVYMPIQTGQVRNEQAIMALATKTEATFDKVIARMEAKDERITNMMVPRQEHELFWKNYERTMERVVKRLDRIEFKSKD